MNAKFRSYMKRRFWNKGKGENIDYASEEKNISLVFDEWLDGRF